MKSIEIKTLIDLVEKQRAVYEAVLALNVDEVVEAQLVGRMQGTLDVISMLKELEGGCENE